MDSDSLRALLSSNPALENRPGVAASLGQSQVSSEQATSVAQFSTAQDWVTYLQRIPHANAMTLYGQFNDDQRSALRAVGYEGAIEQNEKGGFWHKVGAGLDKVGGAIAAPFRKIDDIPGADTTGHVLKAATWDYDPARHIVDFMLTDLPDITAHTYRALSAASEGGPWPGAFDVHMFWGQTEDGEKVYNEDKLGKIQSEVKDPTLWALAKWSADGTPEKQQELFDTLMGQGRDLDAQNMAKMIESPEYKDLADKLNDAKISFGRDLARAVRVPEGTDGFNIVSGMGDAAYRVGMDPLSYVPVGQVWSGARYGLKTAHLLDPAATASRLDKIFGVGDDVAEKSLAQRMPWSMTAAQQKAREGGDELGSMLERIRHPETGVAGRADAQNAMDTLRKRYPQWGTGETFDQILASPVKDWTSFKDWMNTSTGLTSLVSGQTAHRIKILPYRRSVRTWVAEKSPTRKVNWSQAGGEHATLVADASNDIYSVGGRVSELSGIQAENLQAAVRDALGGTRRARLATIKTRTKTRLPYVNAETGMFDVSGHGSTENFRNYALMFVPKFMADRLTTVYATADTAHRYDVIKGVLSTAIESYGVRNSAQGKDLAEKLLRQWDEASQGRQVYGLNGSRTALGDDAALYTHQMSSHVAMPNFPEFMQVMAKAQHANGFLKVTNSVPIDWFTSKVWRASVLMRPALAFRNANEETLNNFMRNGILGETGMIGQYASKVVGQKVLRDAGMGGLDPHAGRAFRALLSPIRAVKGVVDSPVGAPIAWVNPAMREATSKALDHRQWATYADMYTAKVLAKAGENWLKHQNPDALVALNRLSTTLRGQKIMSEEIFSAARRSLRFDIDQPEVLQAGALTQKSNGKYVKGKFVKSPSDRLNTATDEGVVAWAQGLSTRVETDRGARAAMLHLDDQELAVQKVMEAHAADEVIMQNARHAADPEIFARAKVQDMRAWMSDANGEFNDDLWRELVKGGKIQQAKIDPEFLSTVPVARRPAEVLADPNGVLVQVDVPWWNSVIERGWGHLGDMTASLARAHQFTGEYVTASRQLASAEARFAEELVAINTRLRLSGPGTKPWDEMSEAERAAFTKVWEEHSAQGNFIEVHHGSRAEFDEFDNSFRGTGADRTTGGASTGEYGSGHYFTTSEGYAATYGDVRSAHVDADRLVPWNGSVARVDAEAILSGAGVDDAARLDALYARGNVTLEEISGAFGQATGNGAGAKGIPAFNDSLKGWAESKGYVGIRHYDPANTVDMSADSIVVFDAASIHKAPPTGGAGVSPEDFVNARAAAAAQRAAHEDRPVPDLGSQSDTMDDFGFGPKYEDPRGKSVLDILEKRHEDLYPILSHADAQTQAAQVFTDKALDVALHSVLNYVDNPAIRSQAAVLMRNVGPFYRAQEEFMRRWMNIARYSPKALWRANLALEAGQSGGVIETDPRSGKKYLVIPHSGAVAGYMNRVFAALQVDSVLSVQPGDFATGLQTLAPGFTMDGNVHPLSGPIAAIPLQSIETLTGSETVKQMEKVLLSKYGYDVKPTTGLIPGYLKALWPDEKTKAQEQMNAIAGLAAAGITYPTGPSVTAEEVDEYKRLVNMQAKGMRLARGIMAWASPGFPQYENQELPSELGAAFGSGSLSEEFQQIVSKYGYERAYHLYMSVYPTRLPFLVGGNTYSAGVTPPVSAASLDFMKANEGFLKKYPNAAAMALPVDQGEFDSEAWNFARGLGMFATKDMDQYAKEIASSAQKQTYFTVQKAKNDALAKATASGDSDAVRSINDEWSSWAGTFKAANPLVREYVEDGSARAADREERLRQVRHMVADPEAPAGPQMETMRTFVKVWDDLQQFRLARSTNTADDSLARKQARADFDHWAESWAAEDPTASSVYNSIFRYMR